ncbi:hypothetical protein K6119_08200 [Paracrocinitomix mangrovi]|uniref:hypothetical protein n=1 Tax=Paracrocinitomix mangrovi TaxID=2862509 RepID=UPI001C8D177A|nr:hypothetical protein [Paracrocinitomix mangrovi]UKN03494.1 hypothetical protein K6119_08200 [Paracrocinitomix mangrovi]
MSEKSKVNWKSIIAQGLVLSISIYVPFFLQNWYANKQSNELNEQYKGYLVEDLQSDLAVIDSMLVSNQTYLDSAMSIFVVPVNDNDGLLKRAEKALMLGMTDEFYPVTDIETYIDQFREHGGKRDLKLVRELGTLKISFQKIFMIDKRREEYRKEYYTPMYLSKYSIKGGFPEVTDPEYFGSDHFINTVSLLYRLSIQTNSIYERAQEQCQTVLNTLED